MGAGLPNLDSSANQSRKAECCRASLCGWESEYRDMRQITADRERHCWSGRYHAGSSASVFLCQALVAEASVAPGASAPAAASAGAQQQEASRPVSHGFPWPWRPGDPHHLLFVCHAVRAWAHPRRARSPGWLPLRGVDAVQGEGGKDPSGLPINIRPLPLPRSCAPAALPRPVALAAPLWLALGPPLSTLATPRR